MTCLASGRVGIQTQAGSSRDLACNHHAPLSSAKSLFICTVLRSCGRSSDPLMCVCMHSFRYIETLQHRVVSKTDVGSKALRKHTSKTLPLGFTNFYIGGRVGSTPQMDKITDISGEPSCPKFQKYYRVYLQITCHLHCICQLLLQRQAALGSLRWTITASITIVLVSSLAALALLQTIGFSWVSLWAQNEGADTIWDALIS